MTLFSYEQYPIRITTMAESIYALEENDLDVIAAWREFLELPSNEMYNCRKTLPHFSVVLHRVGLRFAELQIECCSGCGKVCFEEGESALMLCDKCKYACYCSETCRSRDWDSRHRVECPFLASLIYMDHFGEKTKSYLSKVKDNRMKKLSPRYIDY